MEIKQWIITQLTWNAEDTKFGLFIIAATVLIGLLVSLFI